MTIKSRPSDFVVEEILADETQAALLQTPPVEGGHALYALRKQGVTTQQAVRELARRLRVPPGLIGYGGLKDRHAETMQHVTVPLVAGLRGAGPRTLAQRGWRIERLGWLDRPLSARGIAGNRFEIIVRGLRDRQQQRLDEALRLLAVEPGTLRFPNYFGDQRFGGADTGRGLLGPHLVRGEYEKAMRLALASPQRKDAREIKEFRRLVADRWGRWSELLPLLPALPERRAVEHLAREPEDFRGAFTRLPATVREMSVESYQSLLWNMTAVRLVTAACEELGTVIVADDPWGDLAFPAATSVPEALRGLALPMLAPGTPLEPPWAEAAESVLAQERLTMDALRLPGLERPTFGTAQRPLFVEATKCFVSGIEPDDADDSGRFTRRRLAFTLPRGAYATVLLRALGQ